MLRNAQAGWTHLSGLDGAQRCFMLDCCARWGLSFWKQFKILSSTTEWSSLGVTEVICGLGSVSLACIGCTTCSLCLHQPLRVSRKYAATHLQLQGSIIQMYLGMFFMEN